MPLDSFAEVEIALNAYSVRIDAADNHSTEALDTANDALTRIYSVETGAKIYTDLEIDEIKDYVDAQLAARISTLATNLGVSLTDQVDGALPSMNAAILQALADMGVIEGRANGYMNAALDEVNFLLNNQIPSIEDTLATVVSGLNGTETTIGELLTGFSYSELREGFDAVRGEGEANLAPLGVVTLRGPATLWGLDVHTASTELVKATLGTYGSFPTNDTDFAECFYFGDGAEHTIGAAYPREFEDDRLYKMTVTMKAIDDGSLTPGVHAALGVTVQNGTSIVLANQEADFDPEYVTVADGVVKHTVFVSGSQDLLDNYGTIAPEQIKLTGAETGNKIYFHVRQNATGNTNGKLAVSSIEILDVTDVTVQVQRRYEELLVESDGIKAWIGDDYSTAVSLDAAIATRTLALRSEMEAPAGSIGLIQADLTDNYVTNTSQTNALASQSTDLKTNFITPAQNTADSALADADAAQNTADSAASAASSAQATANSAYSIASSADGAVATLNNSLNVDAGGNVGGISNFGTVMANFKGEVEAKQVLKAVGGGSTASIELNAFDNAAGTGSAISFDADAILFNGTILTELIDTDQITQVEASTLTSTKVGNGTWQNVHSDSMYLNDPGKVLVLWSGLHSYQAGSGTTYAHDIRLQVNGVVQTARGGQAINDYPMLFHMHVATASIFTIRIDWNTNSLLHLGNRTLMMLGLKR